MTELAQKILKALEEYPQRSAGNIAKIVGVLPASLYPVLLQLENAGKIESRWLEGRYPRRRIYWIKSSDSGTANP